MTQTTMNSQEVNDAAFVLHGACVHSLRFSLGVCLGYPYAPARTAEGDPPRKTFRRLLAASPPPARAGRPWHAGMTLDGSPFDPAGPLDRLADVEMEHGMAALDRPNPSSIVLDRWFGIPRERTTMTLSSYGSSCFLLSIPYWNAARAIGVTVTRVADYYVTHRVDWTRTPRSRWVAVSLEAFWPPERDNADMLIPLGSCDRLCQPPP